MCLLGLDQLGPPKGILEEPPRLVHCLFDSLLRTICRQPGNYPETGSEEINGDLLEEDFWPGITSGLPVIRPEALGAQSPSVGWTSKQVQWKPF